MAQKAPNPWGLYDMLGNVREWCQDRFGGYEDGFQVDPQGAAEGSARVLRGGSWIFFARYARSAYRVADHPGNRDFSRGFRLLSSAK